MLSPRRTAQLGLAAAAAVFVTCIGLLAHGTLTDQQALAARAGVLAPDFRLPEAADPTGRLLSLSDLRGSTVVVAFCAAGEPAADQDRRMAELAAKYAAGDAVRFISVQPGGSAVAKARFPTARFPRLLDADGAVARRYAASAAPTFLVIDPAGVIRYRGPLPDVGGARPALPAAATVG
jgi:peroxiredoxin